MRGIKRAIAGSGLLIGGAILALLWFMVNGDNLQSSFEQLGVLAVFSLAILVIIIITGIGMIVYSLCSND